MSTALFGLEVAFVDKDLEISILKVTVADIGDRNGDLVQQVPILCSWLCYFWLPLYSYLCVLSPPPLSLSLGSSAGGCGE